MPSSVDLDHIETKVKAAVLNCIGEVKGEVLFIKAFGNWSLV